MIDIFNEVYTDVVNTLTEYDANITCSSVYTNTPTSYPFVSIEEIDNAIYERGSDCETENFAYIDYEINIYAKDPLKKSQCDGILNVVDNKMNVLGFVRTTKNNIQNSNETIYRIIVRYTAVVSKNHTIYRR